MERENNTKQVRMTKYDTMFRPATDRVQIHWKVTKAEKDFLQKCLTDYRAKKN